MKHTSRPLQFESKLPQNIQYTFATTLSNSVYARARRDDGVPVYVEQKYTPTYYLPTHGEGDAAGFDGTPLVSHMCDNIREGKEFVEEHPEAYGDIQPEYMFLADCYGAADVPFDVDNLYIFNFDIEVARDAIRGFAETEDPFNPIQAITARWRHMGQTGTVVYGTKPYTPVADETYIHCENEEELLKSFIADFRGGGDFPDIITGWNVNTFDVPYLYKRVERLFGSKYAATLSPFERITEKKAINNYGQERLVIELKGVTVLDYLELYRKFTYSQQESYRLDHIAHVELKKRKLSYTEYRSLQGLFEKDPQKFIEYNIQDVALVDELDGKMKLIELVCAIAYGAKSNLEDTFKQVRLWDIMIYHKLRAEGKQIPPRKNVGKTEKYEGAYVKDPLVGMHDWVVSFDVASMYPHIIRQWNLSPETILSDVTPDEILGVRLPEQDKLVELMLNRELNTDALKEADLCLSTNAQLTRRDAEGFLPNMLKTLYDERKRFKKLATQTYDQIEHTSDPDEKKRLGKLAAAYNNQQQVRKVNLNSAYGALGSNYFRFYDIRLAEAVTLTGQMCIRWVANDVNAYLNRILKTEKPQDFVVASDTDSIYVKLGPVVDKFIQTKGLITREKRIQGTVALLDKFCDGKLLPVIAKSFDDIAEYLNVYIPCMTMAREVIADKGVWTAKKRYILNMYNKEGVSFDKPKLKIMGIEAIKSSTPAIARDMIKKSLDILMNGTQQQLWDYIEECRGNFMTAPFEDVAFPRGVRGLEKYEHQEKSVPIHVRGALAFNRMLVQTNLTHIYEPIHDGEKIKFANLRVPNVFQSHVLSAPQGCPPEWNVEDIIDYHKQFESAFLDPLNAILTCAGWTLEHEPSLFD